MRVQDVMTEQVQTVSPATSAVAAWNLMRVKGIHHLVVLDGTVVAGVLSDGDLGGAHGEDVRKGRTARDLMSTPVVVVPGSTTLRRAANLMRGHAIGCLVVVNDHAVAGIVTTADLLELIGRGVERPVAATTRWTLRHRAPHRHQHRPAGVW
jgi:CBS domain-containing protein